YAEACPKLEESQRLDPGIGTLFNLADCQEHVGKTASALSNFLDVVNATKVLGQSARETAARTRAAALQSRGPKLNISAADTPGQCEINRDGFRVERGLWGSAVPVDPGEHVVTASLPGKKPWRATVTAKDDGALVTVTVPVLEDLTAASGPAAAPP